MTSKETPIEVLRLNNVGLQLDGSRILTDIALSLGQGDVVALVGPNGAGKTSLLRLLAGEIRSTSGQLLRSPAGRRVALMADSAVLYDVLTVAEHISFVGRFARRPVAVAELLESANLVHRSSAYARTLSLGERQRLAFALLRISDPDVILLDEPFNGVDVATAHQIAGNIGLAADRGRSVVIATHHVADLEGLANRLIVLDRGAVCVDIDLDPGSSLHDIASQFVAIRA